MQEEKMAFNQENLVGEDSMEETNFMEAEDLEKAAKRIGWTLIDDSNPFYNIWKSSAGYLESFFKYENPNEMHKYGMETENVEKTAKRKGNYLFEHDPNPIERKKPSKYGSR